MPVEALLLDALPAPLASCPKCGDAPLRPFMRGQVQRSAYSWRTLWLPIGGPRPYCAVICWGCKEIIGYE
jgi:hypothetical protein